MMKIWLCLSLTFFGSVGCGSLQAQYVAQDAANYRTLAPRVRAMVDETSLYDSDQKQDIRDRLVAWELRIKKAQENIASE